MPRSRFAALMTASLALLSGGAAAPAPAQEAPAPQVLPPQRVEVVRIEVVVGDKRGRPQGGLTRDDFVVLEDGKAQPIVQFHAFARPGARVPSAPAAAAEETEDLLPARYVVLAIDDVHMTFESLARARKALARFLDEDLRPEDQVALVTTSGASALSHEFTDDRAVLLQTLDRLSGQGRRADWSGVPHISEYQAELIDAGDPLALDAAVQEILQAGTFQDQASAEQEARRKARAVLAEAIYNSRLTLEALESLCRGLSGLTGRKALYLVSDGFLTGLSARTGLSFDIRRIADAGTRAGVVVYALDTRSLVATAPSVSAASPLRFGQSSLGTIEAMLRRSTEATRDAMQALAADTGGFLVANRNDLRVGLREILKDTDTYYVLAYEPTNTARDGAFRRIEVRLPSRRDLRVRTRSGYFAPDDSRTAAAPTPLEEARRAEQRRAEIRTALGSLAPLTGIPLRVSADFVSLDGRAAQVLVAGDVDVAGLPFVRSGERRQATVEAVAVVHDESGAVVTTLETERSAMDLTEADYEGLRHRGLPYQRTATLPPGRYLVRLAAREEATGLLGSTWRRVEVPDLSAGRLAMSHLFLLKDDAADDAPASGAAPVAEPQLRSVQARPRFAPGERLYVQFYAYNPAADATGATSLVAQAEVVRGNAQVAEAAPEPMAPARAGDPVHHLSRIRIPPFDPGDYELRVTVTDGNAKALATRAVSFTVE